MPLDIKTIGVGVSGGRDSMALLHLISIKVPKSKILIINIEHGIRGETSRRDSQFVIDYANKIGIDCVSIPVDSITYAKSNKLTLEQAARELRYQEFMRLIKLSRVNYIALAHHSNDQAETVLMRILRGTGIYGLTGIGGVRDGIFLRPLLNIDREDIDRFIEQNNIPYIDDETNLDNSYMRNYLRNTVLPMVRKAYPSCDKSLVRLALSAKEDNDYIMGNLEPPEITPYGAILPITVLLGPRSISSRSIMLCFKALNVLVDIERRHIDLILGLINVQNGASLNMPYGVKVYKEYDKLVFTRDVAIEVKEQKFIEGEHNFCDKVMIIKPYQGSGLRFDMDKIPADSIIRYRRKGDYILKFGGGSKSLGDYMTDIKLPRRSRDSIPLVASGNSVLILGDIEISSMIKVDSSTIREYTIMIRSTNEQ